MNKPKFNYILNDLAFSNLQTKCLYTECTEQDIVEFENQLKLKEQELQRKDNIINELKNGIKELDNMFYETFRISQDGYFSISEWELKDFTDKIKELENGN